MDDEKKKILLIRLWRVGEALVELEEYMDPFGPRTLLELDRFHTTLHRCVSIFRFEDAHEAETERADHIFDVLEEAWLMMCEGYFGDEARDAINEGINLVREMKDRIFDEMLEIDGDDLPDAWLSVVAAASDDKLLLEADLSLAARLDAQGVGFPL